MARRAVVRQRTQIAAGRLTSGEFTSFVAALLFMYGPIKKLSRVNANLQQTIAAAERIFEVLDRHTEVRERPGAAVLPPFRESVEFRDVVFAYEDARRGRFSGASASPCRAARSWRSSGGAARARRRW